MDGGSGGARNDLTVQGFRILVLFHFQPYSLELVSSTLGVKAAFRCAMAQIYL